jgi:putative transposase
MPHIKKQQLENCIYFVTTNTHQRKKIFINEAFCDVIIEAFEFNRKKRDMRLLGYSILPDHLHAIIFTGVKANISQVMQSIKGFTSRTINQMMGKGGRLWQTDFYPVIVDDEKMFYQKLDYIHRNPIKHGHAQYPDEWKYSSYRSIYLEDYSVIKVDQLEW